MQIACYENSELISLCVIRLTLNQSRDAVGGYSEAFELIDLTRIQT